MFADPAPFPTDPMTEPTEPTERTEPTEPTEPTERTEPRSRRPREKRVRIFLDRALSASAGVVAASALAVSVYQAYISRQQQKLSAWPYVTQMNTGADGWAWAVSNVGLGPALVRSMRVDVDGKPVTDWGEFATTVLRVDSATLIAQARGSAFTTSTVRRGTVLLPGSTTQLVHVSPGAFAETMRRVVNDRRVSLRVCYCSLYGECWVNDSRAPEPERVRACPAAADSALEFRS